MDDFKLISRTVIFRLGEINNIMIFSFVKKNFFFTFFSIKVFDFVSNLNDECSQLSFEVYYVFVASKLKILVLWTDFFMP